jgi:hypothetical protein
MVASRMVARTPKGINECEYTAYSDSYSLNMDKRVFYRVKKGVIHIRIHIFHIVHYIRVNTLSSTAVLVLPKFA